MGRPDELAFVARDLEAVRAAWAAHPSPRETEWFVLHQLFFPTEEARRRAEEALAALDLMTSYRDRYGGDELPFFLEMMERLPPEIPALALRVRRVLAAIAPLGGDYNAFTVSGSGGESLPPQ